MISDRASPLVYGYANAQLPVYFNTAPVLSVSTTPPALGGQRRMPGVSQNIAPNVTPLRLSPWDSVAPTGAKPAGQGAGDASTAEAGRLNTGRGDATATAAVRPRVVMHFPTDPADMLLSGTLAGGQALSGRAQLVDAPVGKGHVVMFAIRPFWRWQTQGSYFLGFNAILNWNDLDAGKPERTTATIGSR
jgi:hypothetical protein